MESVCSQPTSEKGELYPCELFFSLLNIRRSVVALLELADEQLECSAVIIALPKTSKGLDDLIHSLMYVGGQIVTKPPFKASPAYLLVGLEL